eukprot:2537119-Pleurochrysis_carterae.AAC.1
MHTNLPTPCSRRWTWSVGESSRRSSSLDAAVEELKKKNATCSDAPSELEANIHAHSAARTCDASQGQQAEERSHA